MADILELKYRCGHPCHLVNPSLDLRKHADGIEAWIRGRLCLACLQKDLQAMKAQRG